MKYKYLYFFISALVIVPGVFSLLKWGLRPAIDFTGGTEGSPKIYEKMAQAGIGTVIGMHISEEHKKEAEAANINIVIAGHISSDSLGVNLFLDELEKQGIEIIPCSGLIRVKRF